MACFILVEAPSERERRKVKDVTLGNRSDLKSTTFHPTHESSNYLSIRKPVVDEKFVTGESKRFKTISIGETVAGQK